MTTWLRGTLVNPLSRSECRIMEDGLLAITPEGRIGAVLPWAEGAGQVDGPVLDYSGHLILPGFIDGHTHLPQFPIRGKKGGTLMDWLDRLAMPIELAFADPAYAQALSERFFQALKAHGTTTAVVLSSHHEAGTHHAFEAAQTSGMRVVMGKVMMDQHVPPAMQETCAEAMASSKRLADTWHGANNGLLYYAFTPRYAYSCSPALLEAAGEAHRQLPGSYLQTHLAENPAEVKAVTGLYQNRHSYTGIYHQYGCLGPRTLLAHAIHLTTPEIELLQETGSRVTHCPSANFFLKSGFFPLSRYQSAEIPIALGTDIGAGPDISMLRVMRAMDEIQMAYQHDVSPTEALYYATLAGAEALSLSDETGNLSPGKSADLVVLDTPSAGFDGPILDQLSQCIYSPPGNLVVRTFVRGKSVYDATQPK